MSSLISRTAYARLSAPDLGAMRAFLEDFGLVLVHQDGDRLYMRGSGDAPVIHVTERGPSGVIGFGYAVDDEATLQAFVDAGDAHAIETVDEPGGGRRVRLFEPNGFAIELVAGRTLVEPLAPRDAIRGPAAPSIRQGPSRVRRFAHCAIATPKPEETLAWFQTKLGIVPTDELYVGDPANMLGQFNRIEHGEATQDHHVLFAFRGPSAGIHHISFEVEQPDDIFVGHDHLRRAGYDHVRGIGRHALGAQLFDYWMSPFGQMHEHWNACERMTATSAFNRVRIGEGMTHDHGERPPERFVTQATPLVRSA